MQLKYCSMYLMCNMPSHFCGGGEANSLCQASCLEGTCFLLHHEVEVKCLALFPATVLLEGSLGHPSIPLLLAQSPLA